MTEFTNKHHPIIEHFPAWSGSCPDDCFADFTGSITRNYFSNVLQQVNSVTLSSKNTFITHPPLPPINNEEYFECIAFLSAIEKATDHFVMMELGAGYGRWLVRAAMAMRTTKNLPFKLIGVEAEPRHFTWLLQHFRDNNISPEEHKLIRAAISNKDGLVSFAIGNAADWYGQSIVSDNSAEIHKIYLTTNHPDSTIVEVPSITLASLLENETHVDLIDMDIQGVELDVVSSAKEQLNAKVKQIFIGTHGIDQERGLRDIFTQNGWFNVYDYPCFSEFPTKPNIITAFNDGVQYWINPRLDNEIPDGARVYFTSNHIYQDPYKIISEELKKLTICYKKLSLEYGKKINPDNADMVIEKLAQHRIIWFLFRISILLSEKFKKLFCKK